MNTPTLLHGGDKGSINQYKRFYCVHLIQHCSHIIFNGWIFGVQTSVTTWATKTRNNPVLLKLLSQTLTDGLLFCNCSHLLWRSLAKLYFIKILNRIRKKTHHLHNIETTESFNLIFVSPVVTEFDTSASCQNLIECCCCKLVSCNRRNPFPHSSVSTSDCKCLSPNTDQVILPDYSYTVVSPDEPCGLISVSPFVLWTELGPAVFVLFLVSRWWSTSLRWLCN